MKDPIKLQPVYQTRVWGGRSLETLYGRDLPGNASELIGESWDVVDRPEAQSMVVGGEYSDKSLGELWKDHRNEIFGADAPDQERFPILCKILDVRQTLSVQVHPSREIAEELGGEPKSEFWYVSQAEDGTLWYAGLKVGITREVFEQCMKDCTTSECLEQIPVIEGQGLYVPAGTVHALGAGHVIFEIQENSDTTYRVYDWDRVSEGSVKRELHVEQALKSINFKDAARDPVMKPEGILLNGPEFRIEKICLSLGETPYRVPESFCILAVISGSVTCSGTPFNQGDYFLCPVNEDEGLIVESTTSEMDAVLLRITWA